MGGKAGRGDDPEVRILRRGTAERPHQAGCRPARMPPAGGGDLRILYPLLMALLLESAAAAGGPVLRVLDAMGRPVRAIVYAGNAEGLTTDSCGRAELPPYPGRVRILALGYRTWSGIVSGDSLIVLRASAVPSGVVIPVTGETSGLMRERAPSTTLLTGETLDRPPVGLAQRLNSAAPGIYVRQYGGGMPVVSMSLRGAEAGQTGFSIDGHALQSPLDGMVPAELDMGMFRALEIARGGASSSKPGAISGTVNLLSRSPDAPDMLQAWLGTAGSAGVRAAAGMQGAGLTVSMRRLTGEGQGMAASGLLSGLEEGFRWGGMARWASGATEAPTWSPEASGRRRTTGFAGWADIGGGPVSLSLDCFGEAMRYRADFPEPTDDTHRHLSAAAEALWNLSEWLSVGIGGRTEGVASTALGTHRRTSASARLATAEELGPISLRAEAAADAAGGEAAGTSASASVSLPMPLGGLMAYGSVSRSFRRPTFNDLHWPSDPFAEGNPDLDPETAVEGELGLAGSWGGARASACGYLASTRDQITWLPDGENVWRPKNVARVRRMGFELQGEVELGRAGLCGSLTAASSVDRTEGAVSYGCRMPYRPDLVGGGEARLDLGKVALSFGVSGRSLSYRNRTQTDYIPGYWLLAAGMTVELSSRLRLRLNAENLTGRDYEVTDGYPGDPRGARLMLDWKGAE